MKDAAAYVVARAVCVCLAVLAACAQALAVDVNTYIPTNAVPLLPKLSKTIDSVTERFNVWRDLTNLDPVLKDKWTWDNRYDPELQMRALVVKNRINYSAIRYETANQTEKMAFLSVTYNSGSPIVDRNICVRTKGCDPTKWFAGLGYTAVSSFTAKSTVVAKGYGKSFASISREYPVNVIIVRRPKYVGMLGS